MRHMLIGTVIFIISIVSIMIAAIVVNMPLDIILGTLGDSWPSVQTAIPGAPDITPYFTWMIWAFEATIVVAIIFCFLWLSMWSQKYENEQEVQDDQNNGP